MGIGGAARGAGKAAQGASKAALAARKAAQGGDKDDKPPTKPDAIAIFGMIAAFVSLPLLALMALALLVIMLILIFIGGSQTTSSPDPSMTGAGSGGWAITEAYGGDGSGAFTATNVPDQALVEPIEDAAEECDLLTPVILASQIEYASAFDAKKEGEGGRKGLSQLPPDVFSQYGKDDDKNGEVSALDPKDSIYAHARYFCHLAEETQRLLDEEKVVGDHLTLTLLAWDIGLAEVEARRGMPVLDLNSYPFLVRMHFARFTDDPADPSASITPTS